MDNVRQSDSPFVEMIWREQSTEASTFTSVAESRWEMVITTYQGKTSVTVRGPETTATAAECPPDAEFFGIVFKLGTFMPHLPITALKDRHDLTLPEATNQSFWLLGAAWQIPTFDNADTFIQRMVRDELLVYDPLVEDVLQDRPPDMSVRTLQRRFLRATGLNHKTIQQIERAKQAADLLTRGAPVLDAAFETGFYDQAHLTNALTRFIGQTPAQLIQAGRFGFA